MCSLPPPLPQTPHPSPSLRQQQCELPRRRAQPPYLPQRMARRPARCRTVHRARLPPLAVPRCGPRCRWPQRSTTHRWRRCCRRRGARSRPVTPARGSTASPRRRRPLSRGFTKTLQTQLPPPQVPHRRGSPQPMAWRMPTVVPGRLSATRLQWRRPRSAPRRCRWLWLGAPRSRWASPCLRRGPRRPRWAGQRRRPRWQGVLRRASVIILSSVAC